jgi:hypothetical protein
MHRSPIYQTRSTRVLYRRRVWPRHLLGCALALLLLVAGALLGQNVLARARLEATPIATPRSTPNLATAEVLGLPAETAPSATHQSSVGPSTAGTPVPTARQDLQARVAGTEGLGLLLRSAPGLEQPPLALLPEGSLLILVGETVAAADRAWSPVRTESGAQGWVAAEYLEALLP